MKLNDTLSVLEVIDSYPGYSAFLISELDQESLFSLCYHKHYYVRECVAEYLDSKNIYLMMNDKEAYVRLIVAQKIDDKYLPKMINDEDSDVREIVKLRLSKCMDLKIDKNGDFLSIAHEEHVKFIKNKINESLCVEMGKYIGSPLTKNTMSQMQNEMNIVCQSLQIPSKFLKMELSDCGQAVIFDFDEKQLSFNYYNHISKQNAEIMAIEDQKIFDAFDNLCAKTVPTKISCGYSCASCNQHNEYAEPNQSNGTYICFNCR